MAAGLLAHLAAVPAVAAVGRANPKVYVPITFKVGCRHLEVDGLVDGGNTFASCISKDTFDKLPFADEQLVYTATSSVAQAGGGARLKVLGKLPDKIKTDGFHVGDTDVRYPLTDIYVVQGMSAAFNIGQPFMKANDIYPDYPSDDLVLLASSPKPLRVPMYSPKHMSNASVDALRPIVPDKGVTVPPGGVVEVATMEHEESVLATFEPRATTLTRPQQQQPMRKDTLGDPWHILPRKQKSGQLHVRIKNLSDKPRKVRQNFNLGSICRIDIAGNEFAANVDIEISKRKSVKDLLKIQKRYEKRFLSKLEDLFVKFYKVFSWGNEPGLTTLVEHEIHTGKAPPVWVPQGSMSPDVRDIVRKQVTKWLRDEVISPVDNFGSSWNSRILLVPKKRIPGSTTLELRTVIDYRALNRVTTPDLHPFTPNTAQETLKMMSNATVFSCLDITQGFHCIPIKPEHRYKTAFIFDGRQYWFNRCPFGQAKGPRNPKG